MQDLNNLVKLRQFSEQQRIKPKSITDWMEGEGRTQTKAFLDGDRWTDNFIANGEDISTLKGSPKYIAGDFNVNGNNLTDFVGGPKCVRGDFLAASNRLEDLKDIHKHLPWIDGKLIVASNRITSHVLGVFLIRGLRRVEGSEVLFKGWDDIVNEHLTEVRKNNSPENAREQMFLCQEALINADLKDFAQL